MICRRGAGRCVAQCRRAGARAIAAAGQFDEDREGHVIEAVGRPPDAGEVGHLQLIAAHGGAVPHRRAALEALPGVGRKTANVVLNVAFGDKSTELVLAQTTLGVHEGLLAKSAWNELRKALNSDLLEATARDYADAAAKDADLALYPEHPLSCKLLKRRQLNQRHNEIAVVADIARLTGCDVQV